jgi:hypothetical protein
VSRRLGKRGEAPLLVLRIAREDLAKLKRLARAKSLKPSALARKIIEESLKKHG